MHKEIFSEDTVRFYYEKNKYVLYVETKDLGYDPKIDRLVFKVSVLFLDGQKYSWESSTISMYGNGLFVDSKGKYLFGCSIHGIYCLDLKTGNKIWKKRKMAYDVIVNDDDTLTYNYIKQIFILDMAGNLIDSLNTNYDCSIYYVGDNKFLIRMNKYTWNIVTSKLTKQYVIPNELFLPQPPRIRFAHLVYNTLVIEQFAEHTMDDNVYEEKDDVTYSIDLLPYKIV